MIPKNLYTMAMGVFVCYSILSDCYIRLISVFIGCGVLIRNKKAPTILLVSA